MQSHGPPRGAGASQALMLASSRCGRASTLDLRPSCRSACNPMSSRLYACLASRLEIGKELVMHVRALNASNDALRTSANAV